MYKRQLWYLFMIAMMMVGTIRCVRRQRQKKEKKYKTVLFTGIMAAIMFATLWQYQNTMQGQRRNMGIWKMCIRDRQNIWLETDEIGLGGVWIGIAPIEERMELVHKMLDLPENVKVFSLFAMGYPAEERPQQDRFDPERIHFMAPEE